MGLRPFESADQSAVREIVSSVLRSYGLRMDAETDADLEDVARSYQGGSFYVLEHEGRVVGCGGLYPDQRGQGEIRKMYFLPEARGKGHGRAMLVRLLDDARARGFKLVHLQTNKVLSEALALYRRMGFVERPGTLCGRCDVHMELSVG